MNTRQCLGRALAAGACAALLVACEGNVRGVGQVAAKVNDAEITVHQVNYVLQRTPSLNPERVPQVKKEVIQRLVEQELLVQQAVAHKLDRDPKTLAALEAARREVLSRAYLERAAQSAAKPDASAVKRYYEENPLLFQHRRIYVFNEILLSSRPANWDGMGPALVKATTLEGVAKVLKAEGIQAPISMNVRRSTEQLPLDLVQRFAQTKAGEVVIYPAGSAIVAGEIRGIEAAPFSLPEATPLIEHYLMNRDRMLAARNELARLRTTAAVSYQGEFAVLADQDEANPRKVVEDEAAPVAAATAPAQDPKELMVRGIRGLK